MSKAAKQSIFILIFLLLLAMGFAGYAMVEKQKVEKDAQARIEQATSSSQQREKQYILENQNLKKKLQVAEEAKTKAQTELTNVQASLKQFEEQIAAITAERDDFQGRVDTVRQERDDLLVKLQEKPPPPEPKVVIKYVEREPTPEETAEKEQEITQREQRELALEDLDDEYWADILKQKASLEVEVDKLNQELNSFAVEIEELKKENSDLELEISKLSDDKEEITREIKYGKDLADNLSLELARAKSDKKFIRERYEKMQAEGEGLRQQIKNLSSTKVALERNIIRLTDEKNNLERKLIETESIIQNKIEEIWEIKENINSRVQSAKKAASQQIELPPIIVSASGQGPAMAESFPRAAPGYNGNIVSINSDNNFVIVDLGEKDGLQVGETLNVYRDTEFIAGVEVIQVRNDISAADIKKQSTDIKVGDIVR